MKPLFDQFTFETGIALNVRYGESASLAATLLEEGKRTPAAVFFSQDAGALGALAKAKAFATLPDDALIKVSKEYRASDRSWVGVSGRARVFVYDPRQVQTPPQRVSELLDPKFKGRVGFAPTNASFQAFVTAFRIKSGDAAARKWLTDFKNNGAVAYPSNGAIVAAVDQGRLAVGLVNHYYLYERYASEGEQNVQARNEYALPDDPGALVNVAGVGILKESGDDEAALEFVRYLLSKDAQTYFAQKTFEYPTVQSVRAPSFLQPLETIQTLGVDLSDLDSLSVTLTMLRQVGLL